MEDFKFLFTNLVDEVGKRLSISLEKISDDKDFSKEDIEKDILDVVRILQRCKKLYILPKRNNLYPIATKKD